MSVVDASAIIDLLLPPSAACRDFLVGELPEPAQPWLAPDIILFEVLSAVRRHVLHGALPDSLAASTLHRLRTLPIELVPTAVLLDAAWTLRQNFSAADALYVALAARAREPLISSDRRLARAATTAAIEVRIPPR
ncbi:MAG: type II toxin-antitoxin system VapC family toxin [Acidimicrobiales bacterium]